MIFTNTNDTSVDSLLEEASIETELFSEENDMSSAFYESALQDSILFNNMLKFDTKLAIREAEGQDNSEAEKKGKAGVFSSIAKLWSSVIGAIRNAITKAIIFITDKLTDLKNKFNYTPKELVNKISNGDVDNCVIHKFNKVNPDELLRILNNSTSVVKFIDSNNNFEDKKDAVKFFIEKYKINVTGDKITSSTVKDSLKSAVFTKEDAQLNKKVSEIKSDLLNNMRIISKPDVNLHSMLKVIHKLGKDGVKKIKSDENNKDKKKDIGALKIAVNGACTATQYVFGNAIKLNNEILRSNLAILKTVDNFLGGKSGKNTFKKGFYDSSTKAYQKFGNKSKSKRKKKGSEETVTSQESAMIDIMTYLEACSDFDTDMYDAIYEEALDVEDVDDGDDPFVDVEDDDDPFDSDSY